MDEDKVGLNVEDGEEKKEEDDDHLEVLDKDVDGKNDNEEDDRPKNTKEEMPNNLSFVKVVVGSNGLLPLNINRETLQESNITKVISKKLVRKAIEILRKLSEKDESKRIRTKTLTTITRRWRSTRAEILQRRTMKNLPSLRTLRSR